MFGNIDSTATSAATPNVLEELKQQLHRLQSGTHSPLHQGAPHSAPLQTIWSAPNANQVPQGPSTASLLNRPLSPAPSLTGSSGSTSRRSDQVRVLVAHGGSFRSTGTAGSCEYVGGAQKLFVLSRTWGVHQLQQQLCTLGDNCYQQCNIKYALPGAAGAATYIDLEGDCDVELMWEEWADYTASTGQYGAKLHLFVDCGSPSYPGSSRGRGSGGSSGSGGGKTPDVDARTLLPAASLQSQPTTPTMSCTEAESADAAAQADAVAAAMAGMYVSPRSAVYSSTAAAAPPAAAMLLRGDPRGHSGSVASSSSSLTPSYVQPQLVDVTSTSTGLLREAVPWPVTQEVAHMRQPAGCYPAEQEGSSEDLLITVTENLLAAATMVTQAGPGAAGTSRQQLAAVQPGSVTAAGTAPGDNRHVRELSMPARSGSHSSVAGVPPAAPLPDSPEPQEEEDHPPLRVAQRSGDKVVSALLTAQSAPAVSSQGTAWSCRSAGSSSMCSKPSQTQSLHELVGELKGRVEVMAPEQLQVMRFLGGGAFGEVYLARWHGTEVAVKCLSPSLLVAHASYSSRTSSDTAIVELLKEAAVLASLHHPNLVTCFGVVLPPSDLLSDTAGDDTADEDEDDSVITDRSCSFTRWGFSENETAAAAGGWDRCGGSSSSSKNKGFVAAAGHHPSAPAVVTEYMPAGSLRNALCNKADWLNSSTAKVKMLLDTARGLNYLHSKRLVHFDLKSANLLVTVRDKVPCVKIADFGLTKARSQTYVTGVDSLRGTLPWIAPEILKHPHQGVTECADVYSFGVIMWEVWTCQEPFEGVQLHALLHQLTSPAGLSLPIPGTPDWGMTLLLQSLLLGGQPSCSSAGQLLTADPQRVSWWACLRE